MVELTKITSNKAIVISKIGELQVMCDDSVAGNDTSIQVCFPSMCETISKDVARGADVCLAVLTDAEDKVHELELRRAWDELRNTLNHRNASVRGVVVITNDTDAENDCAAILRRIMGGDLFHAGPNAEDFERQLDHMAAEEARISRLAGESSQSLAQVANVTHTIKAKVVQPATEITRKVSTAVSAQKTLVDAVSLAKKKSQDELDTAAALNAKMEAANAMNLKQLMSAVDAKQKEVLALEKSTESIQSNTTAQMRAMSALKTTAVDSQQVIALATSRARSELEMCDAKFKSCQDQFQAAVEENVLQEEQAKKKAAAREECAGLMDALAAKLNECMGLMDAVDAKQREVLNQHELSETRSHSALCEQPDASETRGRSARCEQPDSSETRGRSARHDNFETRNGSLMEDTEAARSQLALCHQKFQEGRNKFLAAVPRSVVTREPERLQFLRERVARLGKECAVQLALLKVNEAEVKATVDQVIEAYNQLAQSQSDNQQTLALLQMVRTRYGAIEEQIYERLTELDRRETGRRF